MELDRKKKNRVATVIEGNHIGQKAIYIDGSLYDSQGDVDFFVTIPEDSITSEKPLVIEHREERIYLESVTSDQHMVICGGGHVSIPIIKMAKMLEFRVTVLEDRPKFADNARAAGADFVLCDTFEHALSTIQGDSNTYFVIVTRGHRYDAQCLEQILNKDHAYIGMIGSKKRVYAVKQLMKEKGFEESLLDSIYSPIGLNIGAETPAEIAISVMAEIVQVKNKEKGTSGYTTELLHYLITEWKKMRFPIAIITIISRKGSAPRGIGTKMLAVRTGQMIGTIGGGCAEAAIQQQAMLCMEQGSSKLVCVDMTGKEAEEDGMVCGGCIEVFIDCHQLF